MNTIWCIQRGSSQSLQSLSPRCLSVPLSLPVPSRVSHFLERKRKNPLTCSLASSFALSFSNTHARTFPLQSSRLALCRRSPCFAASTSLCPLHPHSPHAPRRPPSDRRATVSLILIQLYNSQTANKVTRCPLKDIHFYDF